jgi:toxin ParE1/3/4
MFVRWTKPAVGDLTHICDYTEEHFGSQQARRAALSIYNRIESLRTHPDMGRPGRKLNTRELNIPKFPFVVIYRIRESTILTAFCTARRNGPEEQRKSANHASPLAIFILKT